MSRTAEVRDTSSRPNELRLEVDVDAPIERTWAAATDWDRLGEWMLATRVRGTEQAGRGLGVVLHRQPGQLLDCRRDAW